MGHSPSTPAPNNGSGNGSGPVFIPGVSAEAFVERTPGGKVVATYTVVERLGSGAFGQVFRVNREADSKEFALKVLNVPPDGQAMVMGEIKSLSSLKHPNIIGFDTAFSSPTPGNKQATCIVMEFAKGQSLQNCLTERRKPLPVCAVMQWFLQLLGAVEYMHSRGCVHRDLKPANIVIISEQSLKIVDLGIAYWMKPNTDNMKTIAGTPAYLDPAVLEHANTGKAKIDGSTDMWALGCILFETLTLETMATNFRITEETGFKGIFETVKVRLQEFSENQDPARVMEPLLRKMLVEKDARASAKELMESEVVSGWRTALNPDPNAPARLNVPTNKLFLAAFIASIFDVSSPNSIRSVNLDYLNKLLKNSDNLGVANAMLEHGVIQAALSEFSGVHVEDDISEMILSIVWKAKYSVSSPRTGANRCLRSFLNSPLLSPSACARMTGKDVDLMLSRCAEKDMESAQLLSLFFYQRPSYASGRMTFYLNSLARKTPGTFLELFSNVQTTEPNLVRLYLQKCQEQEPDTICGCLLEFFRGRNYLTNRAWSLQWQPVLQKAMISQKFAANVLKYMPSCFFDTDVIHKLLRDAFLTTSCTQSITGPFFPIAQPSVVCLNCKDVVCIPCLQACHVGHSWSLGLSGPNVCCQCSKDKCSSRCDTSGFPRELDELLGEPYREDSATGLWRKEVAYDEERKIVTITPERLGEQFCIQSAGVNVRRKPRGDGPRTTVFYYEVLIEGEQISGYNTVLAVGLSGAVPKVTGDLVGFGRNQWGFHGDDGKFYFAGKGVPYSVTYDSGDTIGCGVLSGGEVYFTKNGLFLGIAATGAALIPSGASVYATLSTRNWKLRASFTFQEPFLFSTSTSEEVPLEQWPSLFPKYINSKALEWWLSSLQESLDSEFSWEGFYSFLSKADVTLLVGLLCLIKQHKKDRVSDFFSKHKAALVKAKEDKTVKTRVGRAIWLEAIESIGETNIISVVSSPVSNPKTMPDQGPVTYKEETSKGNNPPLASVTAGAPPAGRLVPVFVKERGTSNDVVEVFVSLDGNLETIAAAVQSVTGHPVKAFYKQVQNRPAGVKIADIRGVETLNGADLEYEVDQEQLQTRQNLGQFVGPVSLATRAAVSPTAGPPV